MVVKEKDSPYRIKKTPLRLSGEGPHPKNSKLFYRAVGVVLLFQDHHALSIYETVSLQSVV